MSFSSGLRIGLVLVGLVLLAACNGDKKDPPPQAAPTYTVGGTITGLSGSGFVLQNNAGDNLALSSDGNFTFATPITSGTNYAVTVATQPSNPTQICTVSFGSGTATANVTNVSIACQRESFPIGGTIIGVPRRVVLQLNGANDYTRTTLGPFTFPTVIQGGQPYDVTILTQPASPALPCTIARGSGTVGNGPVTDVEITCPAAPTISQHPVGTSVQAPATATFTVGVDVGFPAATLQWQISTDAGTTWNDIPGAAQASYTTPPTTVADSGKRFRLVASNNYGSVTSNAATLTVTPATSLGWQAPSLISDGGTTAYDTYSYQVVANEMGDAIAVWTRLDSTGIAVQANRYRHGSGWQGVETIGMVATGTGQQLDRPRAAINRNGNAVVVWELINFVGFGIPTRTDIVSNYYDTVTGWGAMVPVETDDGGGGFSASASDPTVTLSDAGVATAAWLQLRLNDTVTSVMTNTTGGGGWSTPVPGFTDAVGSIGGVQVAGNASGDAVLVWLGRDGSVFHVFAAPFSGGAAGVGTALDADASSNSMPPGVAVLANGNAVVAWASQNTGNVMVNERVNGAWQGAVRRNGNFDGFLNTALVPKVVAGAAGHALVLWPGAGFGGSSGDFIATLTSGTWTTGQMVLATNSGGGLDAAINNGGQKMAVWRGAGNVGEIRATTGYNTNTSTYSTLSANGYSPKIALGGDGVGVAIWIEADGTANRVWAAEFR